MKEIQKVTINDLTRVQCVTKLIELMDCEKNKVHVDAPYAEIYQWTDNALKKMC